MRHTGGVWWRGFDGDARRSCKYTAFAQGEGSRRSRLITVSESSPLPKSNLSVMYVGRTTFLA